jgi:hypothetical protein
VSASSGGTFSGAVTFSSNVSVNGGTIKLDGNYPTGTNNLAFGDGALDASLTGAANTAIGSYSLTNNTSGASNTALGFASLGDTTTGSYNTGIGTSALENNTTASYNTAVGYRAAYSNTTGTINEALGYRALHTNSTGGYNTALGGDALHNNTTASYNVGMGYRALFANTTGANNTGLGYNALLNNTTGYDNTAVGTSSAAAITTGYSNTFIGKTAGSTVTTGASNTIVGRYDGNQGGLDIRTSSNNIVLSDGAGNPRLYINASGQLLFKEGAVVEAQSNFYSSDNWAMSVQRPSSSSAGMINFYNGGSYVGGITTSTSSTSYATSSDYRLKENVDYTWDATTRLKQLKPARFNFIIDPDTTVDGFLAHEAQTVIPEAVTGTKDEVDADGNAKMQGIDQAKLVPLLVKTIQELEARITALENA